MSNSIVILLKFLFHAMSNYDQITLEAASPGDKANYLCMHPVRNVKYSSYFS